MKFSIRDLFLVTVIVALGLGWWVDRQVREARVKQLEKALSEVALYGAPIDWPGSVVHIVTDVMPPKVEHIPMVTLPDSTGKEEDWDTENTEDTARKIGGENHRGGR